MNWEMFWHALSAISTVAAVVVSLYFAMRDIRSTKNLNIYDQFVTCSDDEKIKKIVTIENVGNRPIIINEYGEDTEYVNLIDTSINKYLVKTYEPILIRAGEAIVIEYIYSYNYSFEERDIKNTNEYVLLKNSRFKAIDTTGKFYK